MRFYWVESPVGRIATAAAPDADNMVQEISNMQEERVEFVLSLLQADEASQIGLTNEKLIFETGGSLVVHCRGGIGRSSMVVSAILTHLGVKSNDALRHIEKARGLRVPETTAQREWVTDRDSC